MGVESGQVGGWVDVVVVDGMKGAKPRVETCISQTTSTINKTTVVIPQQAALAGECYMRFVPKDASQVVGKESAVPLLGRRDRGID
jgi:hypothetical protein